ncbi:hypothetical protein GS493_23365 [Rhodococcus hoagii]|nr:hypothetical protein [Prescottella equi]
MTYCSSLSPRGHRYIDHAKAVEAMSSPTAARGIIQQVRNLVKDLPRRQPTPTASSNAPSPAATKLAAIPDATFTRTEELSRSRYALAELKARSTPARTPPEHSRTEATTSTAAAPKASTRSGPWT